ncbi:MAG: ABC transporter permease [Planctomycetes bacterium]|nr:ABC transporter permease [Planctomycetota bacterium]
MKHSLFIARMDLRQMLREKETLLWMFVMPMVFFYFIGTITSGAGGSSDQVENIAVQADGEAGFLFDHLSKRLAENDYKVHLPDENGVYMEKYQFEDFRRQLSIPTNFTENTLFGEQAILEFRRTGDADLATDFDQFRLTRAVYTLLADLVALGAMGKAPSPEAFAELDAMPRTLEIASRPAGKRLDIPSGYDQAIPGILVMFVLMQGLTGTAVLLIIERRQGLLRRLASTPMSRTSVLMGKWMSRMVMAMVQVAVGMIYGTLFFSMNWGPDLPMVVLLLLAWAGFCASLGLLAGCIGRTEGQVIGLGVLGTMVMAALGGCWWPIEITPAWMQSLAGFLPAGWAMNGMHQLISFQNGPTSAMTPMIYMVIGIVVLCWAASKRFRFI